MIYLIGGAPRVGKSIVSKSIAQAKGIEPISTDDMESHFSESIPEERRRELFPLPGFSGEPSENTLTPDERVKLQTIGAESLKTEIEKTINEAINDHRDLVIEGIHLSPKIVRELIDKHGKDQIVASFVGSIDVERVISGMEKNTNPNDWLKDANEVVRQQVAEFVVAFSKYVQEETQKNGFSYLERTDAFESDMGRVTELLLRSGEGKLPMK
ncbi:hypothetical protein KBC54_04650 [Patescibacteria group bacterium]|nr:hypothetical protein [Patescibacteria group bacterium]